jgi:hypothetical protein
MSAKPSENAASERNLRIVDSSLSMAIIYVHFHISVINITTKTILCNVNECKTVCIKFRTFLYKLSIRNYPIHPRWSTIGKRKEGKLTLSVMSEIKRDSFSYHHNQPADNTLSLSVGQSEVTTTTTNGEVNCR